MHQHHQRKLLLLFLSMLIANTEFSQPACYVWFLVSLSVCCLEKEGDTLIQGRFAVILKAGYGQDRSVEKIRLVE